MLVTLIIILTIFVIVVKTAKIVLTTLYRNYAREIATKAIEIIEKKQKKKNF